MPFLSIFNYSRGTRPTELAQISGVVKCLVRHEIAKILRRLISGTRTFFREVRVRIKFGTTYAIQLKGTLL